ncbi:C-type lectin domain family 14 member A isoform X1 [Thunnus maccoyii]|uniref:C-type lectin domain family 14 member A isoform X1 n=2 Tax=Thunnus maccoyii TaxID=8240 RepID=UPI001C4A89EB|nr:C-type lectin domain family 14 member A isoform X1 [Thunnus maccoyii]
MTLDKALDMSDAALRVTSSEEESEKMASWLSSCCIYLWIITLLRGVSAEPASTPKYILNRNEVSFDQAKIKCSPGVLTTLATKQEVADVLQLVSSGSPLEKTRFTYWVGLQKPKNECIVSELPLKGFKWMADGGEEMEMSRWKEEPKGTCTTVRCAVLTGELNRSTVSSWGLLSVSCKTESQFICKLADGQTVRRPEDLTPEPATPESKPPTPESKPATPESKPPTPESKPPTPESKPPTPESKPPTPESKPATPEPEPEPDAGPESDSCIHPVASIRSLSLHPNDSSRILVECWSSVKLELHCSGRPAVWRLQDDSPANFTAICLPCIDGFKKDTSGNCVDIDECGGGGGPCRHTCLNTQGSYKCVCSDQDGEYHDEDSQVCTGNLIWVIVAVAALIVLVVVIAVTVKCCLMRRSKKRAMKKAEKMDMDSKDGKDSFETANEKTTT